MESDQRNGRFKMQSRMPWLVVGMLSLLLSRLAGAQDYQWMEIVIEGTTVVQAWQINDIRQVAISGTTDGRSGIYQDGTFTPLPPLEGFTVGALGINNGSVITGYATDPAGIQHGFILCGSNYTLFSRPGWDNTGPRAIADSGLITGENHSMDMTRSAGFIYDPATEMFRDATPPGSTDTIVQGMNKFGRITGHGREPIRGRGRYGLVWQQGTIIEGKRELLPFLERLSIDFQARARGINDSGVIVGFITGPQSVAVGDFNGDGLQTWRWTTGFPATSRCLSTTRRSDELFGVLRGSRFALSERWISCQMILAEEVKQLRKKFSYLSGRILIGGSSDNAPLPKRCCDRHIHKMSKHSLDGSLNLNLQAVITTPYLGIR